MPRRERDRELARRRKRKEKRKKLRAKGLLPSPPEVIKENEKKRPKKVGVKEAAKGETTGKKETLQEAGKGEGSPGGVPQEPSGAAQSEG